MNKAFIILSLCLCCVFAQAQEILNYPLDTVNGEEVYRYQVEKSIGLYRIGVNFNVAQSEIIRLNPQLRERGLHFGELLYLPTGRPVKKHPAPKPEPTPTPKPMPTPEPTPTPVVAPVAEPVAEPVVEPVAVPDSLIVADSLIVTDTVVDNRPIVELALMLPFESHQTKRSANAERMLEFYQGALLALYDLQNDSVKYRLRVYDTERSELRVNALCDSTELDSVRGILGLAYPIQIERIAAWSEAHGVPTLLPFCDNTDLSGRTQLLQFNSTDRQEADSICEWILQKGDKIHCVVVDVPETELSASIRTLRQQMKAHEISYTHLSLRDLMADSAAYALNSDKENLIILHSDRYQNARILIPHLDKLSHNYRIRIVGQYSWQKEIIPLPQIYTTIFHTGSQRDAYERLWATYFGSEHVTETPRYDLLGYDLMHCLVAWINGEKFYQGLQSTIYWKQVEEAGGWQNVNVTVGRTEVFY